MTEGRVEYCISNTDTLGMPWIHIGCILRKRHMDWVWLRYWICIFGFQACGRITKERTGRR
jgi:hypothetical protein